MTEVPNSTAYSSVVSLDSIFIGFILVSLHLVDITDIDMNNAYLNALCTKKIWSVGGNKYGEGKGGVLIIVSALYGLKSAAFLWISALASELQEIGLKPTMAEPNVLIRTEMRLDENKYYEILLVYVDDVIIFLI